jgi:hypothetical protein
MGSRPLSVAFAAARLRLPWAPDRARSGLERSSLRAGQLESVGEPGDRFSLRRPACPTFERADRFEADVGPLGKSLLRQFRGEPQAP